MTYEQLIRNIGYWCRIKYNNGYPRYNHVNEEIKTRTCQALNDLGLSNRYMNGYSIVGIARIQEAEDCRLINYSDLFHQMTDMQESFFSPAYYLYKIVEYYSINVDNYNPELVKGLICRGLRTLASLFREIALSHHIHNLLPDARIIAGVEQDVLEHTDLLINYNFQDFRIWSYQCNNLTKTIKKIKGKRGELPQGLFILCPFNSNRAESFENRSGWYLQNEAYVRRVVRLIIQDNFEGIDNYNNVITNRSDDDIINYISDIQMFIKEE